MAGTRADANITVRQRVLSAQQIKELAVDKQKRKILEGRLDVQAVAEILCDDELRGQSGDAFILRFCQLLSKGNDYASFSTLKPVDEGRLQLLEKGILKIGVEFQPAPLGDEVKNTLAILKVRWSLATEHGCHTLIDLFLLDAANKSNTLVGIFPEFQVEGVVGDSKFGGSLDYLVTNVEIPLLDARRFRALRRGRADPPFLVVIEAKKNETFEDGHTQLVAEMKILWVNLPDDAKREIFGVLTSGTQWLFFMLDTHGIEYYYAAKTSTAAFDFVEDEGIIVNFLHNFMLQRLPPGVTYD